jgi:hypothetical protein
MSTVVKDLGPVTAYAYAVAGGYTGTEEEFIELLGDLAATVADLESLTVTVTTLTPGSSATASYADGVLALGIPQGAKGDTGTAATIAVGTVTTVAPTQNAAVTNTGSSSAAVFAFSIPRGDGVATVTKTGTSGNVDTYTMTSDRGVTLGTFTVTNGNVSSVNSKTGAVVLDAGDLEYDASETYAAGSVGEALGDALSAISDLAPMVMASFPQETITDEAIATFTDGADGIPVKALTVDITPVQSGSGAPSPDNVRPISGWTGCNINHPDKNLFSPNIAIRSNYYKDDDGVEHASTSGSAYTADYLPVVGGETYMFGLKAYTTVGVRFYCYDKDYNWISRTESKAMGGTAFGHIENVVPNNCAYVQIQASNEVFPSLLSDCYFGKPVTAFVPFGPVLSVAFPAGAGTVYGGSLKLNEDGSADLTVTHKGLTLDGSRTWNSGTFTGGYRYYATQTVSEAKNQQSCQTSIYPKRDSLNTSGIAIDSALSAKQIDVRTYYAGFDTLQKWKDYITENPVDVVYELDEHQTYHITDVGVVKTLLGFNNIWADTGDIDTLTYRVDPSMYQAAQLASALNVIVSMIANVESSYTASKAYSVNDFLSVNGTLYIVTADIANGGTITPNTNVSETTVGAQLAEILNS